MFSITLKLQRNVVWVQRVGQLSNLLPAMVVALRLHRTMNELNELNIILIFLVYKRRFSQHWSTVK